MKLKKLIYILIILALFPLYGVAEDYPLLPTFLKEKVISAFGINTAGKTMLYEKVNIYDDFDAWMIGWFDDKTKIVTGITDTEDIIYYNITGFEDSASLHPGKEITSAEGEKTASDFLAHIIPAAEPKLIRSNSFEYEFADSYNSIPILGRRATVVVDKFSGNVIYYKGFGQTDCSFELLETLISHEHAFELFYDNIGLELVYNTVLNHSARTKAVRPMYILNRGDFKAVDAQTGKIISVSMHDYTYYYDDSFFNPRYYYDNNIFTEEKLFTPDGSVSASGFNMSEFLDMPGLNLSEGYCAKVVPGVLDFYKNANGIENRLAALQVDIVPTSHAMEIYRFCDKFDSRNLEWFNSVNSKAPLVFARAYVEAGSWRLLDLETVKNISYKPAHSPAPNLSDIDKFVKSSAGDETVTYYGMQAAGNSHHIVYARYVGGVRVIGEGASVVYDSSVSGIIDYSLIAGNSDFLSTSFMKTPEQMKDLVKNEISPTLFYVDKNEHVKKVVYDISDTNVTFDPLTGERIDRLASESAPVIAICQVGEDVYTLNGVPFSAPAPIISSGKLLVPVRVISAALGYEIKEESGNSLLLSSKDTVQLTPESNICLINGQELKLDFPPKNISGNIYVSAGSLRSLFGMFVQWDGITNKIYLVH